METLERLAVLLDESWGNTPEGVLAVTEGVLVTGVTCHVGGRHPRG